MTTRLHNGQQTWSLTRDHCGHREYDLVMLVDCDPTDGPANALNTPGLPLPGSYWIVDGDVDLWAWCRWDAEVKPLTEREPNTQFTCKFKFSTKPIQPLECACKDFQFDDPLLEPAKVSGNFVKYTEEATRDLHGQPILNSAWEQIRGPQVEFDSNRIQIKIEQNVATPLLGYILPAQMVDTVNYYPLWGLPPRTIKLSEAPWERLFYGTCFTYYKRTLTFDVRFDSFDRVVLDEGTKVLSGHWGTIGGQGATFNVVAAGGSISSATLGSGGGGYPVSSTFNVTVNQSGASGGTLSVTTDGSGAVTTVNSVVSGGTGYTTASGLGTAGQFGWILDPIPGYTGSPNPNPGDPSHFIRFQDRLGNMSRVILDGGGLPAGVPTEVPGRFAIATANNSAVTPPSSPWLTVIGGIPGKGWSKTTNYKAGMLVTYPDPSFIPSPGDAINDVAQPPDQVYLCTGANVNTPPVGGPWLYVGTVAPGQGPRSRGTWNPKRFYAVGDYISYPSGPFNAGGIPVVKYPASDFSLLSIPMTF